MTWPHPPTKPGAEIQHSWRCPRSAPIVETIKRLTTGQALVVSKCSGCEADDADARLLDQLLPGGPDAA